MKNIVVSVFISLGWLASAAGTAWANGESGGESGLRGLVEPLGVLTFLCLAATFLLGRFMPRNRKKFFPGTKGWPGSRSVRPWSTCSWWRFQADAARPRWLIRARMAAMSVRRLYTRTPWALRSHTVWLSQGL